MNTNEFIEVLKNTEIYRVETVPETGREYMFTYNIKGLVLCPLARDQRVAPITDCEIVDLYKDEIMLGPEATEKYKQMCQEQIDILTEQINMYKRSLDRVEREGQI